MMNAEERHPAAYRCHTMNPSQKPCGIGFLPVHSGSWDRFTLDRASGCFDSAFRILVCGIRQWGKQIKRRDLGIQQRDRQARRAPPLRRAHLAPARPGQPLRPAHQEDRTMLQRTTVKLISVAALGVLLTLSPRAYAQTAEDKFYRAYHLEQAEGNHEQAARLYQEVVSDDRADAALREQARQRLTACREEVAAADVIRLMPPEPLAYVEINRPGQQLTRLLEKLGLLADGSPVDPSAGPRIAVSPQLVKGLLGVRVAAAAITGIDPAAQKPQGVAVFHPGDVAVIRGVIETALPAATRPSEPIGGHPTFDIEGMVFVTLTSRFIIVSPQREEIQGVIDRLADPAAPSLARNETLAELLKDRRDALLFFCVNAKPIMPLVNALPAAGSTQSRELALASSLLDPRSLEALVGRAGVGEDELFLEIELRLAEGHRNLLYHFLRLPPIDRRALQRVPAGVAGFAAFSLGDARSQYRAARGGSDAPLAISALDLPRELLANVISVAIFALPPEVTTERPGGPAIPDIAAVISVHDPAQSEALWQQVLGVASLASGGGPLEGSRSELSGTAVRTYRFCQDVEICLAAKGSEVVLASSRTAMSRALAADTGSGSVLEDPAFARAVSRIGPDSVLAVFANQKRCFEIARTLMSAEDFRRIEPVAQAFDDTVNSIVVDHSDTRLRVSAAMNGIPRIGELLARKLAEERQRGDSRRLIERALQRRDWDEAQAAIDDALMASPGEQRLLWQKLQALDGAGDREGAREAGGQLLEAAREDAGALNHYAWALLSESRYGDRYTDLALRLSQRSNELTGQRNWMYVDTLALAEFKSGNVERAVELERKALELAVRSPRRGEVEQALARFEAALQERAPRD
jgi:hypothetical protein